jgi:hypothetical protein
VNGGAAPLNEWTIRTRFGSAVDALFVKRNGRPETALTTRKNGARGAFRMSHDSNLPNRGRFDATPVAALASGAPNTQRPAARA